MPDICAHADQAPIDVRGDDALGERRNQAGLRSGEWIWSQLSARRSNKTVGLVDEVEDWRNDNRASEDTDDERDLLFPRGRIDQLTRLQILQIVVRNRRHVENHGSSEKREGHERLGR